MLKREKNKMDGIWKNQLSKGKKDFQPYFLKSWKLVEKKFVILTKNDKKGVEWKRFRRTVSKIFKKKTCKRLEIVL